MANGPDPLGKRALYWRPVDAVPDRRAAKGRRSPSSASRAGALGKRALYSQPPDEPRQSGRGSNRPVLGRKRAPSRTPNRTRMSVPREDPSGVQADPTLGNGPLVISCSSCGVETRVRLADFLFFMFPVPLLLPGRKFDRYMTCPSCRKRTWVGVTVSR